MEELEPLRPERDRASGRPASARLRGRLPGAGPVELESATDARSASWAAWDLEFRKVHENFAHFRKLS